MLFNKKVFAISVLTTLMTANVHAAGFAIAEHSASGMGSAFAGAAATAEDASTTYFNPAGLSKLEGSQILVAGHYVAPASSFANNGSSLNIALGGGTISGSGEDGGNGAFIPNFYYATKLNEKWAFGLGINAPFGQSTEYSESWVGRYHATKSEIVALNINPSASFKVNDKLSFGFGASVQYFEATLANQLDSRAICLAAGGGGACAGVGLVTLGDVTTDSSVSLNADDWSLGWNVGLLYDISNETRLGMAYRSSVKHSLAGTADFTRSTELNTFLTGAGSTAFTDTAASAGINLPETLSLSLQHTFNPKWKMLADVTWTRWSRFDRLVVDYNNPAQPTTTIPENWENSLRYSVGVNYQADSKWIYRAGLALDESPIAS
ncbi:MAG: outer membrane protein transport protein, partial [Gammaproteobacteria bacterium]|nr:outer membrane protein transport protein [Gammaproteobacteria bacterium]